MLWTDIQDIAIELDSSRPQVDPRFVRFTDLRQWVIELPGFDDDPDRCNERILEAIQMAWLEEHD